MQGIRSTLKGLEFSGLSSDNLKREYQVIYAGTFEVDGQSFTIDSTWLMDKATAANQMLSEGVKIPCPLEHSVDPTNNAANVIAARVGLDDKGRESLFFSCQFDSEKLAQDLKSCGVSLWSPTQEYVNAATGSKWQNPIRHLAFTRYPRIQDMSSLTLSELTTVSKTSVGSTMTLTTEQIKKVANLIGFEVTDTSTDQEFSDALDAFELPAKEADNAKQPEVPALSEEIIEARGLVLSSLATLGHISPAQKSIFNKSASTLTRDGFNSLVDGLKLSKIPAMGGSKTSGQDLEVDKPNAMELAATNRFAK